MGDRDLIGTERGTERIEAFSDGVFAIAITFVILDVHVQAGAHLAGLRSLFGALLHVWPSYFPYVLSFVLIGVYWTNHHYVFKLFTKTNHALNLLNLLFLFTIAFVPFPTETLGRLVHVSADRTTAGAIYTFGLLLPAATWLLLWLYAISSPLVDRDVDARFLNLLTLQYIGSVAVYVVALVLMLVSFKIGLLLCTGFTLLYLLPPSLLAARYGNKA